MPIKASEKINWKEVEVILTKKRNNRVNQKTSRLAFERYSYRENLQIQQL